MPPGPLLRLERESAVEKRTREGWSLPVSSCPSRPGPPTHPLNTFTHAGRFRFFPSIFTTAFVSGDLFAELMAVSYKCKTMIIVIALVVLDDLVIEWVVLDDLVDFLIELISVLVFCLFCFCFWLSRRTTLTQWCVSRIVGSAKRTTALESDKPFRHSFGSISSVWLYCVLRGGGGGGGESHGIGLRYPFFNTHTHARTHARTQARALERINFIDTHE